MAQTLDLDSERRKQRLTVGIAMVAGLIVAASPTMQRALLPSGAGPIAFVAVASPSFGNGRVLSGPPAPRTNGGGTILSAQFAATGGLQGATGLTNPVGVTSANTAAVPLGNGGGNAVLFAPVGTADSAQPSATAAIPTLAVSGASSSSAGLPTGGGSGLFPGGGGGGGGSTTPLTGGNGGFPAPAVPEPSTWVMLIAGFGLLSARLRFRRGRTVSTA